MTFSSLILIFVSLFAKNLSIELSIERIKELDKMIEKQTKKLNLHTFGIIVTNKTSKMYEKIFGENHKINVNSPFIIGSVSKSFTALAILKLNISLNKTLDQFDLGKYIDKKDAKKITVSDLLAHISGMEKMGPHIIYERGTYHYSNYDYGLLGKIIELTCGKSYQDCMKELIFDPLEMTNTKAKYHEDIIESYDNFLGFRTKYTGLKSEIGDGFIIPAGYISSTIEDMGKYLRLYLNLDKGFEYYINKMVEPKSKIKYNKDYGFGMEIRQQKNTVIYEHSGGSFSFLCQLSIYPSEDFGIYVFTNTVDYFSISILENFIKDIENFLILDYYEGIDSSFILPVHFYLDTLYLIIISIPLTYLIIVIVRKIKKKEYLWFKGIKGKIIFGVDILILIILPLTIIIIIYTYSPDLTTTFKMFRDWLFVLFTSCSALFLTFIIKLVYIFLFNRFFKNLKASKSENIELVSNSKVEAMNLDNLDDNDNEY